MQNGVLYISDRSDTVFGEQGGSFGGGNYHSLDLSVFHMDIRENAKLRVQTYLSQEQSNGSSRLKFLLGAALLVLWPRRPKQHPQRISWPLEHS